MLAKRCPATTKRSMSLRLRKRPGPVQLAVHVGFAPSTAHRVLTRYAVFARIEVLLELLGPGWYQELGTDYGNAAMHLNRPGFGGGSWPLQGGCCYARTKEVQR